MRDVYDFFFGVKMHLARKRIRRLDEMLRPAAMVALSLPARVPAEHEAACEKRPNSA